MLGRIVTNQFLRQFIEELCFTFFMLSSLLFSSLHTIALWMNELICFLLTGWLQWTQFCNFFSFSNVDNSHPLWEYNQYVSPLEEQETKEVLILQDTSQVKAKERKCRMKNFFESRDTLLCES
jgi:hypothetical protein